MKPPLKADRGRFLPPWLLRTPYFLDVHTGRRARTFVGHCVIDSIAAATAGGRQFIRLCGIVWKCGVACQSAMLIRQNMRRLAFAIAQPAHSTRGADHRIRRPADSPSGFWGATKSLGSGTPVQVNSSGDGAQGPICERPAQGFPRLNQRIDPIGCSLACQESGSPRQIL